MNNHFLAEVLAITKKKFPQHIPVISSLSVVENGTYEAPTGVDGYNPIIVNVPTGDDDASIAVLQRGVNFIDYDGSLVQHYSKEEFLTLSAMPSNPSHDGLVAQGWNWTLADAQAYVQNYGSLIIGQMYTTDAGETRIYIYIDEGTPQNRLTFYVRFASSVADNVDIDWGDGTIETKGSTTATNYSHTYATGGDYVIKLKVNTGTISFDGDGSVSNVGNSIYGNRSNEYCYNRGRIIRVEVGNNVTGIRTSAFYNCRTLTSITIPNTVTNIASYAFSQCFSLKSITIPNGITIIDDHVFNTDYSLISIAIPRSVTAIKERAFYLCYIIASLTIPDRVTSLENYILYGPNNLKLITLPESVTSIGDYCFANNLLLQSFTIPSTVRSIGNNVFAFSYGISEYHLLSTTPPTLANSNAFSGIASDCKIYVPYSEDHSILTAYKSAQNWSALASYMVEEPQP